MYIQEHDRIEVVLNPRVISLHEKWEIVRPLRRGFLRVELVVELPPPADDYLPAVRQDLAGGVPPSLRECVSDFLPVAGPVSAGFVGSDGVIAVIVAPGLGEGAVGQDGARGAPDVGEDHEGADGVGGDVVLDGMRGAVEGEGGVVGVVAALAVG